MEKKPLRIFIWRLKTFRNSCRRRWKDENPRVGWNHYDESFLRIRVLVHGGGLSTMIKGCVAVCGGLEGRDARAKERTLMCETCGHREIVERNVGLAICR